MRNNPQREARATESKGEGFLPQEPGLDPCCFCQEDLVIAKDSDGCVAQPSFYKWGFFFIIVILYLSQYCTLGVLELGCKELYPELMERTTHHPEIQGSNPDMPTM